MTVFQTAVDYWKQNLSVIAIRPRDKKPLIAWEEFQTRKADQNEIKSWFDKWPDANIGTVTGQISGMVVIDIDSEEAKDTLKELAGEYDLESAPRSRTGRGWQLFFKHPGVPISNRAGVLPGLDVRGDGGYVILPPSIHPNGKTYRWEVPLNGDLPKLPVELFKLITSSGSGQDTRERFNTAQALAGVPEGQRDETLFRLACKLRSADIPRDMAEALILEAARNCQPPFPESEALAKVENAYGRYPAGGGKAEQDPHNLTSDYREGPSEAKFEEVNAEDLRGQVKAGGKPSLTFLPLLAQEGFFVKGWSHIVAAYPKSGKTELLIRVLSEWSQESILYITEEPRNVWEARLENLPGSYNLNHVTISFGLGKTPNEILDRIKSGNETVVVIDTIRNLLGLHDEKDNSEVARAMIPYIAATRQKGQTPIFVHHDKKSGGDDGRGITGGHAFLGVVNIAIELLRDKGNRRRLRGWGHVIEVPELLYEKQLNGTFKALGSPEAITLEEVKERAALAMDDNWQKTAKVEETLGDPKPSRDNLVKALETLAREGQAERDPPISAGKCQGVAYQWRRAPNFTSDSPSYRSEVKSEDKEKDQCQTLNL